MKHTLTLTAAGLILLSTLAAGQVPAGAPTMDQVNTTLPEEGAPKAVPGSYAVTAEAAFGADGLKIFRPAKLENFPHRDKLPVVIWGNGGCAIDNPKYDGFLETIASHGFLVVTTTASVAPAAPAAPGARRPAATAENLKAGIDWAEHENARAGSALNGKIDTKQVAVMGQSCGGMRSIDLGADPRVKTIGVFNAGVNGTQMELLKKLRGPVLFINGGDRDFMMAPSKATYEAIDKLPAFYGSRHGAGHTATAYHVGGGEFANVASNWVRWQFKKDRKAGAMFVGKNCGLCTNKDWDAEGKRLKN